MSTFGGGSFFSPSMNGDSTLPSNENQKNGRGGTSRPLENPLLLRDGGARMNQIKPYPLSPSPGRTIITTPRQSLIGGGAGGASFFMPTTDINGGGDNGSNGGLRQRRRPMTTTTAASSSDYRANVDNNGFQPPKTKQPPQPNVSLIPPPPRGSYSLGTSMGGMVATESRKTDTNSGDNIKHTSKGSDRTTMNSPMDSTNRYLLPATTGCWVMVYGYTTNEQYHEILNQFAAYGNILNHRGSCQPGRSNWIAIQYESPLQAEKALCHKDEQSSSGIYIGVRRLQDNDPIVVLQEQARYANTANMKNSQQSQSSLFMPQSSSTTGAADKTARSLWAPVDGNKKLNGDSSHTGSVNGGHQNMNGRMIYNGRSGGGALVKYYNRGSDNDEINYTTIREEDILLVGGTRYNNRRSVGDKDNDDDPSIHRRNSVCEKFFRWLLSVE